MNGESGAFMDLAESMTAAGNLAEVIYNLSERSLMAHTLRAVESHICDEYSKRFFPIGLVVEPGVQARYKGKKSWLLITDKNAQIFVEATLAKDQKRVCIAYECYHILEFFRPKKSHPGNIEDICDAFANALCMKHKAFYDDPHKVAEFCKFGHLPIRSRN